MCVSFGIRASGHVRHSVRRPPRCGSAAALPWRSNLAVVLSIAAIAGCGQAPGPQAASNLSSGNTETASDIAARPSASGDVQDPGGAATTERNGRRSAGDASEPGDAAAAGTADGAQNDHPPSDLPSEAMSVPTPSAEELAPPASAPPQARDVGDEGDLDTLEHTVVALLGVARKEAGAAQLHIDATLVGSARERACTMAQGTRPLLSEVDTENVGLVVEAEPDMAARAMHDWWMETSGTRDLRLTQNFDRYGVGACIAGDRVYYAERFGS